MEPGGRRPAPGRLARVQEFVNTIDIADGVDQLADPVRLGAWLAERELLGEGERLGAADMVSGIFRLTIWNQTIPDHLRGRLAGIELLSYSTGPLLGNLEAGAVAAAFGVRVSVVSGGLLSLVGVGVVALLMPVFRAYDAARWSTENQPGDAPVRSAGKEADGHFPVN